MNLAPWDYFGHSRPPPEVKVPLMLGKSWSKIPQNGPLPSWHTSESTVGHWLSPWPLRVPVRQAGPLRKGQHGAICQEPKKDGWSLNTHLQRAPGTNQSEQERGRGLLNGHSALCQGPPALPRPPGELPACRYPHPCGQIGKLRPHSKALQTRRGEAGPAPGHQAGLSTPGSCSEVGSGQGRSWLS